MEFPDVSARRGKGKKKNKERNDVQNNVENTGPKSPRGKGSRGSRRKSPDTVTTAAPTTTEEPGSGDMPNIADGLANLIAEIAALTLDNAPTCDSIGACEVLDLDCFFCLIGLV